MHGGGIAANHNDLSRDLVSSGMGGSCVHAYSQLQWLEHVDGVLRVLHDWSHHRGCHRKDDGDALHVY
jgi:hypothetical protein